MLIDLIDHFKAYLDMSIKNCGAQNLEEFLIIWKSHLDIRISTQKLWCTMFMDLVVKKVHNVDKFGSQNGAQFL